MSTIIEQLQILLENYFTAVIELESALVYDRNGLLIAKKEKKKLIGLFDKEKDSASEIYGALTGFVEKTLKRISSEYEIGSFGTGTFETEDHRLVFTEAGQQAILLSVFNYDVELNNILPYCFLVSEKIASILNGDFVSSVHTLTVPNLELGMEMGIDPGNLIKGQLTFDEEGNVNQKELRFKLIVLGDQAVGKTSLINQFVTHRFFSDYRPTLGISITSQTYALQGFEDGIKINLMIWDLAGQKFFRRVRKHYYLNANAGFIVYDITNPQSFEHIDAWYEDVHNILPDLPIVILGNKIDLEKERVISTEQGAAKAKKLRCSFMETSAKLGTNVKDAFGLIGIGLFFKHA